MQLFELRNLSYLLKEVSADNGLPWNGLVVIPPEAEERCQQAEKELETFTLSEYETLAAGEEEEQEPLIKRAPMAAEIANEEFNGEGLLGCYELQNSH